MVIKNMVKLKKTSAAGFEPARGNPMRFQVSLLNHSDKLTITLVLSTYCSNIPLNNENTSCTFLFCESKQQNNPSLKN